MSKKAYSEREREQIKHDLLVTGLELFSQHGLRNVRLIDIIQGVGISKPFFYTFYTSMEELVIRILDYQQAMLFQLVEAELAREDIGWEEKVYNFFCKILYSRSNHLLVMTQEEEVWVFRRLSPQHYDAFQKGQEAFYAKLLSLWGVPEGRCDPKVFGNLCLSMVLIHNSAERALPFFFTDRLEETAEANAHILVRYIASLLHEDRGAP